ncbi:hypothetical protein [Streptantibioticus ferralitis]|uniref:Uncharacterized protein n=1 Tax=Streptantibioticus ferralitis TaxID=236510 RepID=A0ABT5YYX8_9ACTN|nr:hypothetical protein [Streptantibioticus ferralitis]MDF2256622.1 hypothetical protein [Streptantibioticus ferralitis]
MDESDYADYPAGDPDGLPDAADAEAVAAQPHGPAPQAAAARTWVVSRAGIAEARANNDPERADGPV